MTESVRIIEVPREMGEQNDLAPFFQFWTFYWNWKGSPRVALDFSNCDKLEPWSLVAFAAWARHVRQKHGVAVTVRSSGARTGAVQVRRPEIKDFLEGAPLPRLTAKDDLHRFIECTDQSAITGFAERIERDLPKLDDNTRSALRYITVELLRNTVQHSHSQPPGIAGVHVYGSAKARMVQLVIADTGIGIRSALHHQYGAMTDLEAIKLAMLPHVSGTFAHGAYGSMLDNAGLGLFFTSEMVKRAGGRLFVATGIWSWDLTYDKKRDTFTKRYSMIRPWEGVYIMLRLRFGSVLDFDSLIALCQELSDKARDDPGGIILDFNGRADEDADVVRIPVRPFSENVTEAARIRDTLIVPTVEGGASVFLDFDGVRFSTQSFVHALLNKVFRSVPNMSRLSFINCSEATKRAISLVAAYSTSGSKDGQRRT